MGHCLAADLGAHTAPIISDIKAVTSQLQRPGEIRPHPCRFPASVTRPVAPYLPFSASRAHKLGAGMRQAHSQLFSRILQLPSWNVLPSTLLLPSLSAPAQGSVPQSLPTCPLLFYLVDRPLGLPVWLHLSLHDD